MSKRHSDMCVDQAEGRVQLKEWQDEDRWGRHAVGKQPEEEMFVPQEFIAREGIGCRQSDADVNNPAVQTFLCAGRLRSSAQNRLNSGGFGLENSFRL